MDVWSFVQSCEIKNIICMLFALFRACVALRMRSSLFWDISQRGLVVTNVSEQILGCFLEGEAG